MSRDFEEPYGPNGRLRNTKEKWAWKVRVDVKEARGAGKQSRYYKRQLLNGRGHGRSCCKASCDEIWDCIKKASDKWKNRAWRAWGNCRTFASDYLHDNCCIQKCGNKTLIPAARPAPEKADEPIKREKERVKDKNIPSCKGG